MCCTESFHFLIQLPNIFRCKRFFMNSMKQSFTFFFCFLLVLYTLSILLSKLFTTTKFAVFSVCPACVLSSTSGRCTWQFSGFYISESFVAICLFTISNLLTWKNLGLMGELILFCCVLHGSMSILRNRS